MATPLEDGKISDEELAKRQTIRDQRSGKSLEEDWGQQDRTAIQEYMKRISPAPRYEPRCNVCNHPHKAWMEEMVTKGYSYKYVADHVRPTDDFPSIDRRSLKKHVEDHMRLEDQRIRAELDEAAAELAQNEDSGGRGVFSERGALKILIRKTFELAQAGAVNVEARDMIQMIKLLNDMEVKQQGSRAEENEYFLRVFVKAIQNVCDETTVASVVQEVKRLRAQDDIESEMENMLTEPQNPMISKGMI